MQSGDQEGTTYRTEVSYLEIYNERVKDLLHKNGEHHLKVREHPQDGPYVEKLSTHLVMDYDEIHALMDEGNAIRTTASTKMNDTSSRSHAIFTILFAKAGFCQGVPHETVSKIHLVDLAGSERANATGATGQRLKEGAHINKSLVTLGSVISALADTAGAKKNAFIPYRDSVLTWLLKDSLGGNAKTIMVATISPADVHQSETLSTLRYANRAKNIINKPTVNEDPNVRLIRDLRDEIERLRSMMSLNPSTLSTVQKELALKEAQERHLTEEWTEKWKEAAKILQEQRALALKRTGLGVMLDSEKPHLVGIDEDVLSTGITLYHLNEGDTHIGSGANTDILLKGPSVIEAHCKIVLANGVATLVPSGSDALCLVNAALVTRPTKLSQGCVLVLGKTNMFRYNDPKEAEKMRLDQTLSEPLKNRSLLSQSLSDLRQTPTRILTMHHSEGDIKTNPEVMLNENAFLRISESEENMSSESTNMCSSMASASSNATSDYSNGNMDDKLGDLSKGIANQKAIIVNCLESEQCDISVLNKQIAVLQEMQSTYAKLEYDITRNMWMQAQNNGNAEGEKEEAKTFDEQFASLVEQEVDRRIFQEKILKRESEIQERELVKMKQERELNDIRRQHEKEIYLLKKKLHEASEQRVPEQKKMGIHVKIPTFRTCRDHVEFAVEIFAKDDSWVVHRRFRRFRELHMSMCNRYGLPVQSLPFPSRRLFGSTSENVSLERQEQLERYVNALIQVCSLDIPHSPLYRNPCSASLLALSNFFAITCE